MRCPETLSHPQERLSHSLFVDHDVQSVNWKILISLWGYLSSYKLITKQMNDFLISSLIRYSFSTVWCSWAWAFKFAAVARRKSRWVHCFTNYFAKYFICNKPSKFKFLDICDITLFYLESFTAVLYSNMLFFEYILLSLKFFFS